MNSVHKGGNLFRVAYRHFARHHFAAKRTQEFRRAFQFFRVAPTDRQPCAQAGEQCRDSQAKPATRTSHDNSLVLEKTRRIDGISVP